jgi:hypothetical protein
VKIKHHKADFVVDTHTKRAHNPAFASGPRATVHHRAADTGKGQRTMATDTAAIDFDGILRIEDLCKLLQTSKGTIRRRLREGTFPIPDLPRAGLDYKRRWAGPVVRRWLAENGRLEDEARRR